MKFISNYQKFMYGRYGVDELYNFLFKIYILLFIINLFLNSKIISIIEILLVITIFYRYFSKNLIKRRKENSIYLKIKNNILLSINNIKTKYKDGYIYKKCPKCKKLLKLPLPYKRGIKSVICPKCNKKFRMLVLIRDKIEIISNKK